MLGIDIGSYAIKLAITKGSGKKAAVSKILYEVIPAESREANDVEVKKQIVAKMIKACAKNEKAVALSIPTSSAILKTLDFPNNLSGDDLEGEIQMALINLIPFPLDQVYVDFVSLGPKLGSPDVQEVLVAASRKAVVDSVSSLVVAKTIKEKIIDIEFSAVSALIETIHGKNYQETYAVIDIGYNITNFYVISNNALLFSREQQVGGQQLTEAISDGMGVSLEEAESTKLNSIKSIHDEIMDGYIESFVEQIALAYELYQSANEQNISCIYLTGGGSNVQSLLSALQKGLDFKQVQQMPTSASIKISGKNDEMLVNTLSTVSIGLALRS